ncbi:ABC transporter ATP-binding protein [Nocardioides humi]|uniref:ABC transporter ATP-binding protein n=1 Tax=Nocardioides humi TaxID=449461 RepID=A0ABN2A9W4_9ACTN|nr:ABC transporter ATP-binding protein [Nocardioides humi]
MSAIEAEDLRASYGDGADAEVLKGISTSIPRGRLTVIVGPNGSGKSTLLMTLARIMAPSGGVVRVEGRDSAGLRGRELARLLALLPQEATAPEGIRVWELVSRGRHPHRGFWQPLGAEDHRAVEEALELTGCRELAQRRMVELSGGQRQRVWIALALAQRSPVLLLDEPTAHLDLSHALDVLDIGVRLTAAGKTVVTVLHDLNLAARYADRIIVVDGGQVVGAGAPTEVITPELVGEVFGVAALVVPDPETGSPLVVPRAQHGPAAVRAAVEAATDIGGAA